MENSDLLSMRKNEIDETKGVLDELFLLAGRYRSSDQFSELIKFLSSFKNYSIFNAMLVNIQMRGARYVLPAKQWEQKYGRYPIPDAQPLVMLRPGGPVMFCFDVSQTQGRPLPPEIESPFQVQGNLPEGAYKLITLNSKQDGIRVNDRALGSTLGGYVRDANDPYHVIGAGIFIGKNQTMFIEGKEIPILSEITLNSNLSDEVNFATLTHELAHIYCGHIGPGAYNLWPDRAELTKNVREFEAEATSYLVCQRIGIDTPAAQYLSGYLDNNDEIPEISLDVVFKAVQIIESMTKKRLKSKINYQT
jgi:hypothetical protein